MSANNQDHGAPILPGSPLARTLDTYVAPGLSAGFADRVLVAAEMRPAPLPNLRRPRLLGSGWRIGRRIAIGLASFGVLATAAAATGLLGRLDIPVPSAGAVWESIAGPAVAAPVPALVRGPTKAATPAPIAASPVEIVGPIDTPEELGEAFRRIDAVRQGRREARRALLDERIEAEIERRHAAGLPVPGAEEKARLRERIEARWARREQFVDARIQARRDELQRKLANGEALVREDVLRSGNTEMPASGGGVSFDRLRQMAPDERREVLRRMPPAERRALIDAYRTRRDQGLAGVPVPAPESVPAEPVPPSSDR